LGQSVVMGSGSGIFSGYGRVVLHTGTEVFEVRVPTGEVIPQGSMRRPSWNFSENWAVCGVAEDFGGYLYLAYATGTTITRARVPDGATSVISTFTNLADMANWVASPTNNRWYFHHESTSQFGGGSETLGFADASYSIGPPVAAPDVTNAGAAEAFVGGGFFYQITATNQPTSFSATGLPPGLVVNPANGSIIGIPTAVGVYDCTLIATNEVGSDSQIIRITTRMPLPSLSDDFDPGIDGNLWAEFGGTVTANTLGQQAGAGSTGNSLYFTGAGSRYATTLPIDARTLTAVSFTVALANGPSGNWESVDAGEEPVLEYALDGRNFTRMAGPYYNRAWRSYVVAIPAAARSVATSFRWRQLSASGATFDQWALEDVVIGSSIPLVPEISVDSPVGTEMVSGVSTVNYGGVGVSLTSSRSFTVRNDGGAELNNMNVVVTGADANEFRVRSPPATSIPSGAASSFNLIFAPTSSGAKQASLRITSNDADEAAFQLVVTGSALVLDPDIAIEQPLGSGLLDGVSTVNFGNTLPTQAVDRTFVIRNTGVDQLGGISLNVLGQDADLFTVVSSPSSTVSAGGSTSFTVRYLPTIHGQQSAVLLITSNDLDENPFEITLAGTADVPLAYYSIFANQAYVSTSSGSTYARMVQLLQAAGNAVVNFTGTTSTDWDAAFHAAAVIIPPLEGLPIPMDQDSVNLIRLRTAQGKGLIVVGKNSSFLSSDVAFLNSTFGWSLMQGNGYNQSFLDLRMPTNRFPQSPNFISLRSSSAQKFKDASLPLGAQRIYANDVTTMSFYKGSIAFTADESALGASDFDAFFRNLCPFIIRNGSIADMRVQTPDATMQPDTGAVMDLGASAVGATATYGLNITNTGSQPLTGLQASFSGLNASDFSLAAALPSQLAEGGKYTVNVRMRPSASGIRTAKLTLTSNSSYSPVFDVQLSGIGSVGVPEFYIPPSSSFDEFETLTKAPLFFASNYSSVSYNDVTIFNLGTAPLGIKSVEITGRFAGDFILGNRSPLSLQIPVGGSMSIPVTYRGSFFDPAVAQMRILTNDTSEGVFDVMLINGDEDLPSIFVSNDTDNRYHYATSNLSFGTLTLGLSTVKKFTIGNNGGFNLTGISLAKSGLQAADYIVSALPKSSLIPGDSQSFTVTFNPKNGGFRNATLRLVSNSQFDNPLIINLSAYVDAAEMQVADAVQTSNIYVDGKSQLPFGLNLKSGQSVTRGLMVSNQGTRPMTIGETVIDGPNAAAFSITQFDADVLAPSAFSPLGLRFQGSLPGTYNATLHIVSSDVDESPFDLKLTAHVAEPDIGLELSTKRILTSNLDVVEFADVKAPTLVSRKITIRNLGNAVLNLNSATITGLGAGSFGLRDFAPVAIAPKGSTAVYLDYSATPQRNLAASFRIISNDPDEAVFHLDLLGIGHQEYAPQVLGTVQDRIAYAGQPVSFVSQFEGYQSNVYQWFKGPTPDRGIYPDQIRAH
ncbi:MAG: choice-of-anchor D domain-containing protein, partial [Verrucomicrobia bacterium]|nr:choice-of-anchor D domain-containing protein [Verrucomicrobiota bacterium]